MDAGVFSPGWGGEVGEVGIFKKKKKEFLVDPRACGCGIGARGGPGP